MALSIREALQLPVMAHTSLIAGQKGINNDIKWVTTVEVVEDITRFQDGEFLITTGFDMHDNTEKQAEFEKLLHLKKLSGVAIYTDFYLSEIPEGFIHAANQSCTPLIKIPPQINFSMITKAILEQIVNKQMTLLEHSLSIHKELTSSILNDQSLSEITKKLANLTTASTYIFNDFCELIYKVNQNPFISIRSENNTFFGENEFNIKEFLKSCQTEGHYTHREVEEYRISACPIIARKYCFGWIMIIKPLKTWNELDDIAIGHAVTVCAIEYLKQKAVLEKQILLQGDFLEEIIHQNYSNENTVIEKGRKLGYDITAKQTVFYFTFENTNDENISQEINRLYALIDQVFIRERKQYIIRTKLKSIMLVTIVSGKNTNQIKKYCYQLIDEIEKQWEYHFHDNLLQIGIGNECVGIKGLSKSAKQAKYAVKLSRLLDKSMTTVHYSDLGLYSVLIEMKESGFDLKSLYKNYLGDLIHQKSHGVDLFKTAEAYLLNNENIQVTANKLFIHRHTLKYRLNLIETKTGLDLKLTDDRMKLQLGIFAYKLIHYLESQSFSS